MPSSLARVAAAAALLTAVTAIACKREAPPPPPVMITGVTSFDSMLRAHYGTKLQDHTDSVVAYPQTPPTAGPHHASWQNCGVYGEPIRNELGVHSMEHGAVWITYRPDLPAAEVETLRKTVSGRPYVLLSPFPNLPGAVYATGWGVQLKADSAGDTRITAFLNKYVTGPQTPEPGAPCTNGQGIPIG